MDGPDEQVLGLLVRKLRQGPFRGPTGVGQRPLTLASAESMEEVVGQLDDPNLVVAVERLNGSAHARVEPGLTQRAESVVYGLLHQGVQEAVVAHSAIDLTHEACGHGRIDQVEGVVGELTGLGDDVEIEIPTHHRGHRQELVGRCTEAGQAPAEDIANARRHGPGPGRGHVGQGALARQQPGQLAHQERIALGASVHGGHCGQARLRLDSLGHEATHVGLAESPEGDADQVRLAGQRRQCVLEAAAVVVGIDLPVGAHHERPAVTHLSGHEAEQLHRSGVGPVHVIEDDHHGPVGTEAAQERADGLVEAEPGRRRVEWRGRNDVAHQLFDLGHELGGRGGHLLDQAGLSDAGLARYHHDPPRPTLRTVERSLESAHFPGATHQRGRARCPAPHRGCAGRWSTPVGPRLGARCDRRPAPGAPTGAPGRGAAQERLGFGNHHGVGSQRQVGLQAVLGGSRPQLVEAGRLDLDERLVAEVGQHPGPATAPARPRAPGGRPRDGARPAGVRPRAAKASKREVSTSSGPARSR